MGAMALFGEKYGNLVRIISFDQAFSVELCGGTHVAQTGTIGAFKIVSESAVAAGVRRIEALTAADVMHYLRTQEQEIKQIRELLKNPADLQKSLRNLWDENQQLKKAAEQHKLEKLQDVRKTLKEKIVDRKGISTLITSVPGLDADSLKHLVFDLRQQQDNMVMVLASEYEGKALLSVMLSDNLVRDRQANAVTLIKELGKFIQGGGGGQPFFATAGGKNPVGIPDALKKAVELTEAL